VLYRGAEPPRTLRYCLGPLTEHTSYKAEAVGIVLAMHLLGHERNVWTAWISLDNQAVITALDIRKPGPGQNIINNFLQLAEKKGNRSNKAHYNLEVTWVKGHMDIGGNEKVDAKAKKAAGGKTSKARNLPEFLMENTLPLSISAVRQDYKRQLKEKWRKKWKESP
jgi:ribonuclease HI